ncbi:FecR domain-containing protein, partial [Paraburkholderia bengalensis]
MNTSLTTPGPTSPQSASRRASLVTLAIAGALAALALQPAWAQQPNDPQSAQSAADGDPPSRVARLNYMAGTVTTEPAGASDWSYAQVNRPLTTGDQLWNDKGARSELHVGSTAVRMGGQTSLDILNLDDNSTQLKVAQGTLSTRVRAIAPGTSYEIDTPNVALGINGPGDYRVDVAPDGSATTVAVRSGSATVYGDNGQVPVAAGQQITFTGTSLQQTADSRVAGPDAFDEWAAGRDAAEDRSVSARYVSREMPGYQDLDANGTWRSTPQYGDVWVPSQEPQGWAPYRNGHWIWQAPWGWTWVDDAPWGFAPYHYGRWAYVDDAWAWVPGQAVASEPAYAPALVAFVGDGGDGGGDWGVNLAVGGVAAAGLAWFALGPGEPWHPHWGHDWSPRYYQRVNNTVIVNNRVDIHNNFHNTYLNYGRPGAVTAMPATAFVRGQPTNRFAHPADPAQWRNARFSAGAPGIAPVKQSFGPGMRNTAYRPPANVMARPVVGTREPGVPAAYHDRLAQHFAQGGHGRVPGAGEPFVRTAVPAHFGGQTLGGNEPVANVRLVRSHAPGQTADVRGAPGGPGAPGGQRPGGSAAPQVDAQQHGVPGQPQHGFA